MVYKTVTATCPELELKMIEKGAFRLASKLCHNGHLRCTVRESGLVFLSSLIQRAVRCRYAKIDFINADIHQSILIGSDTILRLDSKMNERNPV
ncbi:13330_t:CDS:2, partial [Acaulospora colombiana]